MGQISYQCGSQCSNSPNHWKSGLTLLWECSLCDTAAAFSTSDSETMSITSPLPWLPLATFLLPWLLLMTFPLPWLPLTTFPLPWLPLMTFPLPRLPLMTSLGGRSCWLTAAFCVGVSDLDLACRLRCLARPLSDRAFTASVTSCEHHTVNGNWSTTCEPLTTRTHHSETTITQVITISTKQQTKQNTQNYAILNTALWNQYAILNTALWNQYAILNTALWNQYLQYH